MRGGDLAIRQARTPQHKVVHTQRQSQFSNNDEKGRLVWLYLPFPSFLFACAFTGSPTRRN
jgi:hypothetical protein